MYFLCLEKKHYIFSLKWSCSCVWYENCIQRRGVFEKVYNVSNVYKVKLVFWNARIAISGLCRQCEKFIYNVETSVCVFVSYTKENLTWILGMFYKLKNTAKPAGWSMAEFNFFIAVFSVFKFVVRGWSANLFLVQKF